MAAYAVSPNGNDITLPASTTTAQSTVEATGLVGGMENASATSLTDQTVAAVATVIESSDGKSRTMSFNLEPADLGKLTIQITQSGEAIAAQIIASELASSDLLSAQKETLQETLSELGFDDASVDVSHDSQTSRDDKETSSQQNAARSFTFSANQMAPLTPTISSGNGLDIVA
jgi:flagellar hook-length control protein FliK